MFYLTNQNRKSTSFFSTISSPLRADKVTVTIVTGQPPGSLWVPELLTLRDSFLVRRPPEEDTSLSDPLYSLVSDWRERENTVTLYLALPPWRGWSVYEWRSRIRPGGTSRGQQNTSSWATSRGQQNTRPGDTSRGSRTGQGQYWTGSMWCWLVLMKQDVGCYQGNVMGLLLR